MSEFNESYSAWVFVTLQYWILEFVYQPRPTLWCAVSEYFCIFVFLLLPLWYWQRTFFVFWASCYCPLLGRARFRGRCSAAIRLSHRPEPSGRAVRGEVDGLDIGGQHGRRFVPLLHTHRPQKKPYPICTCRSGNVRYQCGGGLVEPKLFLGGSFRGCGCRCRGWKCGIL